MPGPVLSPVQALGVVYGIVLTFVCAYLWKTARFTKGMKFALLFFTSFLGFAILSPMLPLMFQELVLGIRESGIVPLAAVGGMSLFMVFAFLFGRQFCGSLCPVGALQEILSHAPAPRIGTPWKAWTVGIRFLSFLVVTVLGVVYGIPSLGIFGIQPFFRLNLSAGLLAFLLLLLISLFVYRPFCRFFCPPGALYYIFASGARWKIRRTGECIECGKCERVCPTNEAKRDDLKGECYLCMRCIEACPEGALRYGGMK